MRRRSAAFVIAAVSIVTFIFFIPVFPVYSNCPFATANAVFSVSSMITHYQLGAFYIQNYKGTYYKNAYNFAPLVIPPHQHCTPNLAWHVESLKGLSTLRLLSIIFSLSNFSSMRGEYKSGRRNCRGIRGCIDANERIWTRIWPIDLYSEEDSIDQKCKNQNNHDN